MKSTLRKFFRSSAELAPLFKRFYTVLNPRAGNQLNASMLQAIYPQISIGSLRPAIRDACEKGSIKNGFRKQVYQIEYSSVVDIVKLTHAHLETAEKEEAYVDEHDDNVETICDELLKFENGGRMDSTAIARLDIVDIAGSLEDVDDAIQENAQFIRTIIRVEIKYKK